MDLLVIGGRRARPGDPGKSELDLRSLLSRFGRERRKPLCRRCSPGRIGKPEVEAPHPRGDVRISRTTPKDMR